MRLGVLDIGSNTVHLLLVDAHPGARPVPYKSHKRALSLIKYLTPEGAINEEGQTELLEFVWQAREFAQENKADDFLAFCTSAIRDAANGTEVLDLLEASTGVRLQELTGQQESSATFHAVRSWCGWSVGSILNLDIGGGSLEVAYGSDSLPSVAESVDLGSTRVTRLFLPGEQPGPKDVKRAQKHIREVLSPIAEQLEGLDAPDLITGTSKTFRALARVCGAAPSSHGPMVPRFLHQQDLRLWTKRLEAMPVSERSDLPGVSVTRAPSMLGGALVALGAMEAFGVETMKIIPWALREGLILKRFDELLFDSPEPLDYVGVGHVPLKPAAVKPVPAQGPFSVPGQIPGSAAPSLGE